MKYTLLAGLWCSSGTPPMFQYLKPIMEQCKVLETQGNQGKIFHMYCYYNDLSLSEKIWGGGGGSQTLVMPW